jgi:hypothetical protein
MTGAPNHRFTTDVAIYNDFTTTQGGRRKACGFCQPVLF